MDSFQTKQNPTNTSKPEDNTPLQAQQEEVRMEETPFTTATQETSTTAVVPSRDGITRRRNWQTYRNLATDLRIWVGSASWTTSSAIGANLTPTINSQQPPLLVPQCLMDTQTPDDPGDAGNTLVGMNQFTQAYQTHSMYRSDYNVYVTVNGTQFHSGSVMVVAVPTPHIYLSPSTSQLPNANKKFRIGDVYNQAQLGIFPSARLLPRTNSQVKIHCPFVSYSPWNQTAQAPVDYAIYAFVETKLGIPTTGTAPTLTLNFEVEPVNAEFMAPHRAISNVLPNLTFVPPSAIPAPAILEYEAPNERIIPGAAAIASENPGAIQTINWRNHLQETSYLPPRVEHFQALLSRPTIKALIDVGTSYTAGTAIAHWDVSPINNIRNLNTSNNVKTIEGSSFLESFSRFFLQWTGSINYTLEWTGPAVSAGRIMIGYQPGIVREYKSGSYEPQLPSGNILAALSNGPHVIWDLSNSTSVTLPCEFALGTPWAAVNPLRTVYNTGSSGATTTENGGVINYSTSGSVFMALMSPIVTPTTTQQTFQILVHESAGPDFNLRYFAPRDPITYPIYNGVVDQGPPVAQIAEGMDPLDDGILSVSKVLAHPRLIATGSCAQNKTLSLPLTLISYGSSSNTAKIASGRVFPSLFSEMRADLRIIVTSNAANDIMVAYQPPGSTPSVTGDIPVTTAAITNAAWTMLSLRADNVGFELKVPFPGIGCTFQTSHNHITKADTVYKAEQDQFDPGSLGVIHVIPRSYSTSTPNANVWVFIGFENASVFMPRPFGPIRETQTQPQAAALWHEDFDEDELEADFEAPLNGYDPKECCYWIDGCFNEIESLELDDDAEIWNEMEKADIFYFEMPFPITMSAHDWHDLKENKELLNELPKEFPAGKDFPVVEFCGEYYPMHHKVDFYNPTREYPQAVLPTPIPEERNYWFLRNQIKDFIWLSREDAQEANRLYAWDFFQRLSSDLPNYLKSEIKNALSFALQMTLSQPTIGPNRPSWDYESDEWEDETIDAVFQAPLGVLPAPPPSTLMSNNSNLGIRNHAEVQCPAGEDEAEVDDEPPPCPYIYKLKNGLYTHWGIAYKDRAISLKQEGMSAVVSFTNEDLVKAEKHSEIGMAEWFRGLAMVGTTFPNYNAWNNCTTWTEIVTGQKLTNTGVYLTLGLAAAAVTTALIFQAPLEKKQLRKVEMPLWNSEDEIEPEQTIPRVRMCPFGGKEYTLAPKKRCMFFTRRKPVIRFNAPINLSITNPNVERMAAASACELQNTLTTYTEMAPQIQAAVTNAAASLQDTSMKVGEFVEKIEKLVDTATEFIPKAGDAMKEASSGLVSEMGKKIGSIILKAIGYILIIFGNPNPATIAGVVSLMASEVLDSHFLRQKIKSAMTSFSHKIQTLFLSYFGLDTCVDDPHLFKDLDEVVEREQYLEERREQESATFEAPPAALINFNQTALAMKNIDWIIEKIKDLIAFVIDKLKGKQQKDPKSWLSERAGYIVQLYDDSVAAGSCQNVDESLLEQRLKESADFLSYATNNNLNSAAQLLSKTVSNYRTVRRKLNASSYEDRPEPLVVYVHGGAGIGKSVLSNMIASAYCKRKGLNFKNSVFTTPPGSEYFDGYTGQPVHIIDDFCQNTTGEDVKLFCQMVSTTRFSPPMASLEEKGVNYCSKLIIATSNLSTPQSNEIRIPDALERRCYFKVRTILADAFKTPSGRIDLDAALKPLGPAKTSDFKADCAYLNGAAITLSVYIGNDRTRETMDVYGLIDSIFDELDRREGICDKFHDIIFQAPQPGDSLIYQEGVIPQICQHQNHDPNMCNKVIFRKGADVWTRDFNTQREMRTQMSAYWEGKIPEPCSFRRCPCSDLECGKVQFENGVTFNFRSKSLLDLFVLMNQDYKEIDVKPQPPTPFKSVVKQNQPVEELKQKLMKIQKMTMISFSLTALGLISSVIAGLYFLLKKPKTVSQGPYSGMPGQSKPAKPYQRPTPVRNVVYEAPLMPQIFGKIESNVFDVEFLSEKPFSLSALGLGGRLCVGNHHAFSRCNQVKIRGKLYTCDELKVTRLIRGGQPTDLVFFTLPDGNEFKNITRFFLSRKDRIPRDDAILISRSKNIVMNMCVTNVRGVKTANVWAEDTQELSTFSNVITYDVASFPGLCGAPILSRNPAHECVLGIHFAGSGKIGMAIPIYKEDFAYFFEATLQKIEHPGKPTHVPRKSNLVKSPVYGTFPVTHEPAILTRNDKRLDDGVVLDEVMFGKHTPDQPAWKELEPAMSYVVNDLMSKLGFNTEEKIEMWTMEQAINGSGVMDGIDMAQSAGYPYNVEGRSRRSFFNFVGDHWEPTTELISEVEKALAYPDQFYFTTFLKDELRPSAKVRAGKTRLVDGDSLPRCIAYRMIFGPLFERMLAKHGPEIHSAVGCNPDVFWTELYHKIGPAHYPYVFDLDYSCFDSTEPADSFLLMAKYFQPYFSFPIEKYFKALAISKHVYESNAFEMIGGMPSGCVGTSMFNCINNSAYIVSALIYLKINPESVSWICYGDDVIIATHERALSRRIAEFYHTRTCLKVTPASKSGDFPEESTIYDVTFLKRYFQPDSNYPELIHPYMPLDVIKQSVMWRTSGPFQSKLDSLCLLAFHAGGQAYRNFVHAVDTACRRHGENYVFKPFEYLMAVWYSNFGL
nr:MAG: polyprotein [Picornaviridae sp.]